MSAFCKTNPSKTIKPRSFSPALRGARPVWQTGWEIASRALLPAAVVALSACTQPRGPAPEYPRSETLCQYVGLEAVETETPRLENNDSISFVAVYRFSEPSVPAPKEPLTVKFRVNRSRANELRSHLESQPEVVCTPDRDLHYQVRVKPLPEPEAGGPPPALEPPQQPPPPGSGY